MPELAVAPWTARQARPPPEAFKGAWEEEPGKSEPLVLEKMEGEQKGGGGGEGRGERGEGKGGE